MARKPISFRPLQAILAFALATVFTYAGIVKILDPSEFAIAIETYQILPYEAGVALALLLPWIEIIAATALLIPRFRPGALLTIGGLCIIFLFGILQAWLRGLDIQCGCFGSEAASSTGYYIGLIFRDLLLLGICIWLWKKSFPKRKIDKFELPA